MKALTFHGNQTIRYESIPDPCILEPTDVIVKVNACAICGSDLHVYHEREKGIDRGTAMGHEFVGEIVELGDDVESHRKGDIVMSPFTTSCGSCFYCRLGLTCRCIHSQLFGWVEKGQGLQGAQAEFVRVPLADTTLRKIPRNVSWEEALLLGDVMSTGYYCARQAEVNPSGIYAVVGCGPVGLMTVIGAKILGAQRVLAIDQVPSRLAIAKKFGAETVEGDSVSERILEMTDGRGADAVMEAVGSHSAVRLATDLVRPGGIISSVGVCTDAHLAFSPVEAYNKNLTYKIGRCPARSIMDKLVPVVQKKQYDISSIFSHRLGLSEGSKGYDIFANRRDDCLKVMLTPIS